MLKQERRSVVVKTYFTQYSTVDLSLDGIDFDSPFKALHIACI
jgi:hypothetical protein